MWIYILSWRWYDPRTIFAFPLQWPWPFDLKIALSVTSDVDILSPKSERCVVFRFYRATRMQSAAVARWCLSVRLSHAGILSTPLNMSLNISSKFFLPSGRPPFYFFHTKRDGNISTWNILTGLSNSNARRYETISPIFRFISEMMQVRAIVTTASEYEIVHKL